MLELFAANGPDFYWLLNNTAPLITSYSASLADLISSLITAWPQTSLPESH